MSKLRSRLRAEEGMTLIELLIAMTVMSIGIAALVAGFSSGVVSINHSRLTSTAGSLADQQMELYRQASFSSVPTTTQTPSTPNGPDGHTYWMQVDGSWACVVGAYAAGAPGTPGTCSSDPAHGIPASRPVKTVTINVRDGSDTSRLLFSETTTFDSSTS